MTPKSPLTAGETIADRLKFYVLESYTFLLFRNAFCLFFFFVVNLVIEMYSRIIKHF